MDPTQSTPDLKPRHQELNPEQPLTRVQHFFKHYGTGGLIIVGLVLFFAVRWLIRHFITQRAGGYDDGTLNAPVLAALLFFIDASLALVAMRITWPRGFRVLRSCLETDLLQAGVNVVYRPSEVYTKSLYEADPAKYGSPDREKLIADIFNVVLKCFQLLVFLALYGFYFYLLHQTTLGALGLIPHDAAGLLK